MNLDICDSCLKNEFKIVAFVIALGESNIKIFCILQLTDNPLPRLNYFFFSQVLISAQKQLLLRIGICTALQPLNAKMSGIGYDLSSRGSPVYLFLAPDQMDNQADKISEQCYLI